MRAAQPACGKKDARPAQNREQQIEPPRVFFLSANGRAVCLTSTDFATFYHGGPFPAGRYSIRKGGGPWPFDVFENRAAGTRPQLSAGPDRLGLGRLIAAGRIE